MVNPQEASIANVIPMAIAPPAGSMLATDVLDLRHLPQTATAREPRGAQSAFASQ